MGNQADYGSWSTAYSMFSAEGHTLLNQKHRLIDVYVTLAEVENRKWR